MFASSLGILGNQWFWVAVIVVLALGWMAKEIGKTANNPWVKAGAKGFWGLFR
jgi:hypothetical protein